MGTALLAVAGGVVTGIGLLLFAQQSGVTGITPMSAVLWTAIPGTISGLLNQVVGGLTQAGTEVAGTVRRATARERPALRAGARGTRHGGRRDHRERA